METLGVYVSVPFCRAKCSFCNFASGVFADGLMADYVGRVVAEMRGARGFAAELGLRVPQRVDSIYFGGGDAFAFAGGVVCAVDGGGARGVGRRR